MPTASSSNRNPRTQLCLAKMEQAQIENKHEQSSFVCGLTVCPAVSPTVLIWRKAMVLSSLGLIFFKRREVHHSKGRDIIHFPFPHSVQMCTFQEPSPYRVLRIPHTQSLVIKWTFMKLQGEPLYL